MLGNAGCGHENGVFSWLDVGKCWLQPREPVIFVAGCWEMPVSATGMRGRGWSGGNGGLLARLFLGRGVEVKFRTPCGGPP